ncbi:UDP-N-acetylmuramoyl-L-alanine--D-glutamate ligase [Hydrogenimonas sp.]
MKRLSLFGYGKTTRAIADKLGPATFYDDKIVIPHKDESGNLLMPPSMFDPSRSDLEIPSPGFPPNHPLIEKARNLISEYDLFLSKKGEDFIRHRAPYTIWISGTNGKTTTTRMVTHLLAHRGAICGGNIGTPLAQMSPKAPIWVLETSSFTLHYTRFAKPDLYLLLPITPDHLSWHGGAEEYAADKLKPLRSMQEGEAILLPEAFKDTPTDGFKIPYDSLEKLARYFGIDIEKVNFEGVFLLDALLALGVSKILFDEIDYEKINSFTLDPHRQEKIIDRHGRIWINDSKATNIDATIQALPPWEKRKIHLILGGDDKGVDLNPLFEALKSYDVTIYAIGQNAEKIVSLGEKHDMKTNICKTLARAIEDIDAHHTDQSVALLSPAAASLDQFSSYAARGDLFKELISSF